jgi:hypothetical protein
MAQFSQSTYQKTYTSFSGTDIRAYFGNVQIGTLQGISFNTTREVAPLYVMGWTNPRSFSRGKRAIAGSMVFTVFDKNALTNELIAKTNKRDYPSLNRQEHDTFDTFGESADIGVNSINEIGEANGTGALYNSGIGWKERLAPQYADQLPLFDVVLVAHNEFGAVRKMAIIGCMVLNNASGVSIDDIMVEESMTYVAREIHPWHKPDGASN